MKFIEGKIISRFTVGKKQIEVIFRFPKSSDAKQLMKSYEKIMRETAFLSRISPLTLSEENKWLKGMISKIKNKNSAFLLAVIDGKIVGSASVIRDKESMQHTGIFGIAISQGFSGLGIGTRLAETILGLAKNNMKLEIVKSCCFSGNERSLRLHKKFGFKIAGNIEKGIKKRNKYWDEIILYRAL